MITLIDVIKHPEYQDSLLDFVFRIEDDVHHNKNNYKDFENRLKEYSSFTILLDDDQTLLAMSGLYRVDSWPKHVARGLDRTYYFNWPEVKSGFNMQRKYASQYMWPYQVKRAEELGYRGVFVSIQKNRRAFTDFVGNIKEFQPSILPGYYNTCHVHDEVINSAQTCWQNLAIYKIKPFTSLDMPNISEEEYKKRYKK